MVDWLISSEAGQTVLRLVHSGFGEGAKWDDQVDGTLGGWRYFLWNLDFTLTRHRGVHRTMVSARKRVPESRAQFWESLFTSGLLGVADDGPRSGEPCTVTLGRTYDAIIRDCGRAASVCGAHSGARGCVAVHQLEGGAQKDFHAGFWLSTYGLPADTASELQRTLDGVVAQLAEPTTAATL